MEKLSQDEITKILEHLTDLSCALQCRLVNKTFDRSFQDTIMRTDINDVFPRSTFLEMRRCMCCSKIFNKKLKAICYTYDRYPKRILLCCDNFFCFSTIFHRFIEDSRKSNLYPFVQWKNDMIWVKRTSGQFSRGRFAPLSPLLVREDELLGLAEFERETFDEIKMDSKIKPCRLTFAHEKFVRLKDFPKSLYDIDTIFQKLILPCKAVLEP
jgi:hypothetical protein